MTGKHEGKFTPGTIFQPQQVHTAALYNMLVMINAPDPSIQLFTEDNEIIKERCTDRYLDFMKYINDFHAFFAKHVRGSRNTAFDDIIQRFAFAFTIGLAQHCGIPDIAALHPVLARIAEKMGADRFRVWVGRDTQCSVDVADEKLVFTVRNDFNLTAIKKNCKTEFDASIAELYPGFKSVFIVRPPPRVDRDKDNARAMALADSINAEDRARRLPTAADMLIMSSKGGDLHITEKPMPAGLTEEEKATLRKGMRQLKKELFDEFIRTRSGDVALTH